MAPCGQLPREASEGETYGSYEKRIDLSVTFAHNKCRHSAASLSRMCLS